MVNVNAVVQLASDMDEPLYMMDCACKNLGTMQEALERGNLDFGYYADGIMATYVMFCKIHDDLKALVDNKLKEVNGHE